MDIPTKAVCSGVRAVGVLLTWVHSNAHLKEADFWALLDTLHQASRGSDALALYPGRFPQHESGRTLILRVSGVIDHLAYPPRGGFWPGVVEALRDFPPVDADALAAGIQEEAGEPPAAADVSPAKYLTSWREILIALGMKHNSEDRQKVSRLNKTIDGPINIPGKGKQPFVERGALLEWWNRLEAQVATQNRQRNTAATVASHHPYSRDGEVLPDIGGGEKKRRRQNRTR